MINALNLKWKKITMAFFSLMPKILRGFSLYVCVCVCVCVCEHFCDKLYILLRSSATLCIQHLHVGLPWWRSG